LTYEWSEQSLELLLNSSTKKIELNRWMPASDESLPADRVSPFLEQLLTKAPNLQFFSLDNFAEDNCEEESPFFQLRDVVISQIVQLKELRHLSLFRAGYMTDANLLLLTRHLKKLVVLKVIFIFIIVLRLAHLIDLMPNNHLFCLPG